MFEYLYYKLYQAVLKGSLRDIPRIITPIFLGCVISVNLLVINALLAKLDVITFFFTNKKYAGVLAAVLIALAILYYRDKKADYVLEKYSQENRSERIRGNIIVSVYVAISFLAIFAVAFFKPGKL